MSRTGLQFSWKKIQQHTSEHPSAHFSLLSLVKGFFTIKCSHIPELVFLIFPRAELYLSSCFYVALWAIITQWYSNPNDTKKSTVYYSIISQYKNSVAFLRVLNISHRDECFQEQLPEVQYNQTMGVFLSFWICLFLQSSMSYTQQRSLRIHNLFLKVVTSITLPSSLVNLPLYCISCVYLAPRCPSSLFTSPRLRLSHAQESVFCMASTKATVTGKNRNHGKVRRGRQRGGRDAFCGLLASPSDFLTFTPLRIAPIMWIHWKAYTFIIAENTASCKWKQIKLWAM